MADLFTRAGMTSTTSGTGTITLGSAIGNVSVNTASFQSFSSAGVVDQNIVPYLILDSNGAWEVGTGTYTASGTTLSRTVKFSSNSNSAISLSGNEQVFVTAIATDGFDVLSGFTHPFRGFDNPVNLQLNASVASSLLTIAVKGNNGNDPSPTNPVLIPFRDSTLANGDPVWRNVTSALSINTNAVGATFGTANTVPFRLWICAFDNAGTVVLAFYQTVTGGATPTGIASLNESNVASTTAVSGSATSAGVFYTPNGTTVTSKSFCVLGYVDYANGLTTAGTYASAPTTIELFGAGVYKPGDVVQMAYITTTSATSVANSLTLTATNATKSISPSSAPNLIRVEYSGTLKNTVASTTTNVSEAFIVRGSTTLTSQVSNSVASDIGASSGAITATTPVTGFAWDAPGTTASTTYTVKIQNTMTNSFNSTTFLGNTNDVGRLELLEYMV